MNGFEYSVKILELLVKLVEIAVWPVLVLIIIQKFKDGLSDGLSDLVELTFPWGAAKFNRGIRELQRSAEDLPALQSTDKAADKKDEKNAIAKMRTAEAITGQIAMQEEADVFRMHAHVFSPEVLLQKFDEATFQLSAAEVAQSRLHPVVVIEAAWGKVEAKLRDLVALRVGVPLNEPAISAPRILIDLLETYAHVSPNEAAMLRKLLDLRNIALEGKEAVTLDGAALFVQHASRMTQQILRRLNA